MTDIGHSTPCTGMSGLIPPLLEAIGSRNESMIYLLLDERIDVNTHDVYGLTTLMYACCYGKERMVSLLIQRGANLHLKSHVRYCDLIRGILLLLDWKNSP